jgi:hypothetical protein
MKTRILLILAISGLLAWRTALAAEPNPSTVGKIVVTFDHPENFTDIKDTYTGTDSGEKAILDELKRTLESKASGAVSPGQTLELKFTNIDLAGDFEPQRGPQFMDVRVVKEIYIPRYDIEWRLLGADGQVLREGKKHLQDLAFMQRLAWPPSDPLRFDKEILQDWLRSEFKAGK